MVDLDVLAKRLRNIWGQGADDPVRDGKRIGRSAAEAFRKALSLPLRAHLKDIQDG